jgi:hypothetical protein
MIRLAGKVEVQSDDSQPQTNCLKDDRPSRQMPTPRVLNLPKSAFSCLLTSDGVSRCLSCWIDLHSLSRLAYTSHTFATIVRDIVCSSTFWESPSNEGCLGLVDAYVACTAGLSTAASIEFMRRLDLTLRMVDFNETETGLRRLRQLVVNHPKSLGMFVHCKSSSSTWSSHDKMVLFRIFHGAKAFVDEAEEALVQAEWTEFCAVIDDDEEPSPPSSFTFG